MIEEFGDIDYSKDNDDLEKEIDSLLKKKPVPNGVYGLIGYLVLGGQHELVKKYLKVSGKGVDPTYADNLAVHYAYGNKDVKMIEILLSDERVFSTLKDSTKKLELVSKVLNKRHKMGKFRDFLDL